MTLLGTIRQKSWLVVGFIAVALVSFFINPDTVASMFGKDPNVFGEVNGEKITREEYAETLMMMQNQAQSQGQPTEGLEEQAWQQLVQSKLIEQEFNKLGLKLTDDFFWNQLPYDPMFAQYPDFKASDFKKEIEQLRETGRVQEYNHWLSLRKPIEYRMMARQLLANISSGVTSNKKEAEAMVKQRDEVANIEYVKVDYEDFARKNPIKVSAQDLADYIKKYPITFKVPETRSLGIVYFKAEANSADEAVVKAEIEKLYNVGVDNGNGLESFKNTKNDSLFVLANSSVGFNPNYIPAEHLPEAIKSQVAGAGIGQTFGPYKEQNYWVVSKVLDKKTSDSIRSRHILISYKGADQASGESLKRTKEEAKALAHKIATEAKANPAKFNEYLSLSADGSAQNGGDLGWRTTGQSGFVPEFQNYLDKSPKGAMDVVESQFGYHIINITDRKPGAMSYKIANLAKEIKPSDATTSKIHSESTQFAQQIQGKSFTDFSNLAKTKNYAFQNPKMVERFQVLQGLGTDKDNEILKWAFDKDREKGDTEMFTTANGDRIVVYLNGKTPQGLADPEAVREHIEPVVKNKILAKKIQEKIASSNATTVEQVAKLFGTQKQSGQINLMNPTLGMAVEPKVAGASFGIGVNKVSKPIEGETGVYVVLNKGLSVNEQPSDLKQIQKAISQQNAGIFPQAYLRSLQAKADIKDYRAEVYEQVHQ